MNGNMDLSMKMVRSEDGEFVGITFAVTQDAKSAAGSQYRKTISAITLTGLDCTDDAINRIEAVSLECYAAEIAAWFAYAASKFPDQPAPDAGESEGEYE